VVDGGIGDLQTAVLTGSGIDSGDGNGIDSGFSGHGASINASKGIDAINHDIVAGNGHGASSGCAIGRAGKSSA